MRLLILIGLITFCAPAAAQIAGRPRTDVPAAGRSGSVWARDLGEVRERIGDGRRSGQLSRREARLLRREAGQIDTLGDRYGAGGLSDAEARELETRNAVLRAEVDARRSGARR